MSRSWGPTGRDGGGAAIGNEGLYGRGAPGGGMGAYGAPNAEVVGYKKPRPPAVQPQFPQVTNEPAPLAPPPKPAFDPRAPGGMAVPNVQRNFLAGAGGFDPQAPGGIAAAAPVRGWFGQPGSGGTADPQRNYFGGGEPASTPARNWLTPGTGWSPLQSNAQNMRLPELPEPDNGPRSRGPLLPGNTAPAYGAGAAGATTFMSPGWWHASNGEVVGPGQKMQANSPGWWHGQGEGQGLNQAMAAESGQMGGGGGGFLGGYQGGGSGGGYAPGVQEYVDSMNFANQRNAERQNNVSSGYEAMKDWIGQMYGNLGQQQRKDVDTTFDKEKGRLTQDMISRGLTASTVLDNMQKGNERTRSEALARLDDELTKNMVGATLPVWTKELDFLTDIKDSGPDLGLMAQLLQQANSAGNGGGGGGGYGGGAGVPITIDSGDIGYMQPVPSMSMGMGGYGNGRGMTVPFNRAMANFLGGRASQNLRNGMGPSSPIAYSGAMGGNGAAYPDDYDYGALFGSGPGGSDYQFGSAPAWPQPYQGPTSDNYFPSMGGPVKYW